MSVHGEVFFILNGWMNFLALMISSALYHVRFSPLRAVLSAASGAVYAVLAWQGSSNLRGPANVLFVGLCMVWISFGKKCLKLFPLFLAAGLLLSGMANYARRGGAQTWLVAFAGGGVTASLCVVSKRGVLKNDAVFIRIQQNDQLIRIPGLVDSGNILSDGISGLPVIITPAIRMGQLLPPGTVPRDLSTLPSGWRLIQAKTIGGNVTLMCFYPGSVSVGQGNAWRRVDAVIAVSESIDNKALIPGRLFEQ